MRKICCFLLVLVMMLSASIPALATTPASYTSPESVDYVIVDGTVVNWGTRGETATFLTTYAADYYTDSYNWVTLSALSGGTGTSDAYNSELYQALQAMMVARHDNIQGYQDTREYYQYTDCVNNDHSKLASFYSGTMVNSTWDSGKTYNREHTWPRSKCLNQSKAEDSADIMMLRPTIPSENGSRGNKAYGESSGYQDPGADVRGDCARMMLYGYVRWGNTQYMWGSAGVMESLDILLRWMEEDPVDTWELARNDSVESITGVRNVFVDYPEYAWLLFGAEIPEDMATPSGKAAEDDTAPVCTHTNTEVRDAAEATCGAEGYTGDTYCIDCDTLLTSGETIAATGEHAFGEWMPIILSLEGKPGHEARTCATCGYQEIREWTCPHRNVELRNKKAAGCKDGYTGDTFCLDCEMVVTPGETIAATGEHIFGAWVTMGQESFRQCTLCSLREMEQKTDKTKALSGYQIMMIIVCTAAVAVIVVYIIMMRKQWKAEKKKTHKKK